MTTLEEIVKEINEKFPAWVEDVLHKMAQKKLYDLKEVAKEQNHELLFSLLEDNLTEDYKCSFDVIGILFDNGFDIQILVPKPEISLEDKNISTILDIKKAKIKVHNLKLEA